MTLGGDHTTTLSALRSTYEHFGPVSVIHFDSHIGLSSLHGSCMDWLTVVDTWDPKVLGMTSICEATYNELADLGFRRRNISLCVSKLQLDILEGPY